MNLQLLHLLESAAMTPAQFFLASLWQGLLLAGAAWMGMEAWTAITRRLAPRPVSGIAPRTRFLLWMIVLVLAVVVPLSTFLPGMLQSHPRGTLIAPAAAGLTIPAPQLSAVWAAVILFVWGLASLFCLARLIVNGWRLRFLARNSRPFSSDVPAALRAQLAAIARRVELRISGQIDAPVAAGFFHPAIVIPDWLAERLTPEELNQVVMHELAHLQRGDDWTNLLQKFVCALFPLNPALLWVERRLCREREMACDDAVLAAAVAPRDYAACLTGLAEKRMLRNQHALAPGAWQRRSELAERVHRILKHRRALPPLRSRPVIVAFVLIYVGAGLALARCPRLVHFVPAAENLPISTAARNAPAAPGRLNAAHLTRTALETSLPNAQPDALSGMPLSGMNDRIIHKSAHPHTSPHPAMQRNAGSNANSSRPSLSASLAARSNTGHVLNASSPAMHRSQPQLIKARYAQRAASATGKLGPRVQIVFTLWEIVPAAAPGLGPTPAPSFIAISPSAAWIVFQL